MKRHIIGQKKIDHRPALEWAWCLFQVIITLLDIARWAIEHR